MELAGGKKKGRDEIDAMYEYEELYKDLYEGKLLKRDIKLEEEKKAEKEGKFIYQVKVEPLIGEAISIDNEKERR